MSDIKIYTGIDIISINRFSKKLLENSVFLDRCFTKREQSYCFSQPKPSQHFAARFAAKEATIKALSGMNISAEYNCIEIINEINGRPRLLFHINSITEDVKSDVSLSHSETSAIAVVILYSTPS